jgi:hypothetical protein
MASAQLHMERAKNMVNVLYFPVKNSTWDASLLRKKGMGKLKRQAH